MNRYMVLENKLCKELDLLEEKYRTGADMSEGDLRRLDLLSHSIKSLATYIAMKQNEQPYQMQQMQQQMPQQMSQQMSQMNSSMGGQMSSGGNSYGNSYMNSYQNMPNQSGHYQENYPKYMPFYPEDRRW